MTREQALLNYYTSKKQFFDSLLHDPNNGNATARYVWRKARNKFNKQIETYTAIVKAQLSTKPKSIHHAKNNSYSYTPISMPVRHN
jgi:hypothetical protein